MRNSRGSTYPRHAEILAKHRRQMRRQVYIPLAILVVVIIAVPVALVLGLSPDKFGTVTSFMSLVLLVPTALLCLIPYVIIVAMAVGVKGLNGWLPDRFATTRTILHRASTASQELARQVASPFIWLGQRFAWLERFIGGGSKPPKAFTITPDSPTSPTERDL